MIVELIDHTSKIAGLNERGDLVERLARARERINDPQIRVVIAGQLKQGKSQLLNSLLNMPVARVGDDETTVLATVVSYGEPRVGPAGGAGPPARRRGARASSRSRSPSSRTICGGRRRPAAARCCASRSTAPSPLLNGGLAFIDTPGVGGHGQPHLSATLGLLPDADAMLMVSDTSQEFTEPETDLHPSGARNLPGGNDSRHQDRPLPALARDRRGQRGAPAARRAQRPGHPGVVDAAQPRHRARTTRNSTRSRTSRRSSSSSATRCCPARTTGSATRCSPKCVRRQSI